MGAISDTLRRLGIPLDQQQRREIAALDDEFSEMKAEIQRLKAQNLKLQAKVNPLEREIERLKHRIEENSSNTTTLPEIRETILLMVFKHKDLTTEQIAFDLKMEPETVVFHLEELMDLEMVGDTHWDDVNGMRHWHVLQPGRRYLDRLGKLP